MMMMMVELVVMMMILADILPWSGYHHSIQATLAVARALWRSRRTGAGHSRYC
jgi:hypothetical protein